MGKHFWSGKIDAAMNKLKDVFQPYTEEMFQQALQFAEKWNLHTHIQDTQYDHLIVTAGV